jgi:putative FmdB family regulatory protein
VPTYEYRCIACDHRNETREGFDAPAKQACPVCGGLARRLLFPPPIVFKGSGFYITDSRKGTQATLRDNDNAVSASSGKSSGSDAPAPAATSSDTSSTSSSDSAAASSSD